MCSSRIEGLSTVVIEAAILQKPIVTTMCSGMQDILGKDNSCACIVPNNTKALYGGIKKVLLDENLRKKYSENIEKRKERFDINKVILDIEKILDE